jgi:preprotein translocase subunit SecA
MPPPAQMPLPSPTNWQRSQPSGVEAGLSPLSRDRHSGSSDSSSSAVVPTKAPQTTIDALEREFARKKERDLAAARQAGGSTANGNGSTPRRATNIGRNDPCHCGSGKKYKKCHGANA